MPRIRRLRMLGGLTIQCNAPPGVFDLPYRGHSEPRPLLLGYLSHVPHMVRVTLYLSQRFGVAKGGQNGRSQMILVGHVGYALGA